MYFVSGITNYEVIFIKLCGERLCFDLGNVHRGHEKCL